MSQGVRSQGSLRMTTYHDDQIPATRYRLQEVRTYEVLVADFDRIEEEASQVGTSLQFAMACFPVGIALTVTLLTVPIPNERLFDGFFLFMSVSYLAGVITGVQAWRQRGRLRRLTADIRAQQGALLGDEGKEFRPAELASLPLESAPMPAPAPAQPVAVPVPAAAQPMAVPVPAAPEGEKE